VAAVIFRTHNRPLEIGCDSSGPLQAVLQGGSLLFCGPGCEDKYCLRSSSGAMRKALFRLERGVCQMCKLDCHALLQSLRLVYTHPSPSPSRGRLSGTKTVF